MDGFDEITPTHAEKAAVILSELMKTKVGKVWVTSRPADSMRRSCGPQIYSKKSLTNELFREMCFGKHIAFLSAGNIS
jgi:hypothetical protein